MICLDNPYTSYATKSARQGVNTAKGEIERRLESVRI